MKESTPKSDIARYEMGQQTTKVKRSIFAGGGKKRRTKRKKPSWHGREQHIKQTQFTDGPSRDSNPDHISFSHLSSEKIGAIVS